MSEQIAMGAGAGETNFRFVRFVNQKPVRCNMAFAFREPVPDERMISELRRKCLPRHQQAENLLQLGDVVVATVAEFQVALELCRKYKRLHSTAFNMASTESYRERLRLQSRSLIAARVVSFGMSFLSLITIWHGKPRCSIVCMRSMFMAVEVVMPRRSKRRSACFLISGLTRNAIVAEFVDICLLLFDNREQYSISCAQEQAGVVDFNHVEHVEHVEMGKYKEAA